MAIIVIDHDQMSLRLLRTWTVGKLEIQALIATSDGWRRQMLKNLSLYTVYSDLEGYKAAGGGSIPQEICITGQRPEIEILDEKTKSIHNNFVVRGW